MFKRMALTAWALNDPFQPYSWNCFCISASRQPFSETCLKTTFFWNLPQDNPFLKPASRQPFSETCLKTTFFWILPQDNLFLKPASRQTFSETFSFFYHVSYTGSFLFCMQTLCSFLTLTGQVCQTAALCVELLSHCACVCAYTVTVPVCKMDWANQATQTAVRHPECVLNCLHVVFVWPCISNSKHWFTTSFLQPLPYLVTP